MRLGAYDCEIKTGTKTFAAYRKKNISERHRHRYEFNHVYRSQFAAHGMIVSGTSPDGLLPEIIEIPKHPWFLAVQFHPEFKSKPTRAHSLFVGFIQAAVKRRLSRTDTPVECDVDQEVESLDSFE